MRGAEIKVNEKGNEIQQLQQKLIRLKTQYKSLLFYAYKHRNKFGKLMYIFAANNYNEAIKRGNYLERIADIQKKQFLIIRQHQGLIKKEISSIEKEKAYKLQILQEKRKEKEAIEKDKVKQEGVYKKFKQEEGNLLSQLKSDEKKKEVLKQKIQAVNGFKTLYIHGFTSRIWEYFNRVFLYKFLNTDRIFLPNVKIIEI